MSEGIIRALLEDAGYRVIDCGIETVIRELVCLTADEYLELEYPDAMRDLPDFTVMTKQQNEKQLVEVKYRSDWGKKLFMELRQQVKTFRMITLVTVYSKPPEKVADLKALPSRFMRSCRLKFEGERYFAELNMSDREAQSTWIDFEDLPNDDLWWKMKLLQDQFPLMAARKADQTLMTAVQAIQGILTI
jgi:hypothetical protein